jgi:predicted metal-dependent peptidase
MEEIKSCEFDFLPPDKRMLYSDVILPDNNEELAELNNALIVLDVSSSVEKDELVAQVWQIRNLLSELEFTGSIIAFAGDVHQEGRLTDKKTLQKFIEGLKVGGGTDWAKVVEYVKRQPLMPAPILVFTDGYFYSFDEGLSNIVFITQEEPPPALKKLGKVIQVK